MAVFLSPCFPSKLHVPRYPLPVLYSSFKPISSSIRAKPISATIPARDRIIDFGKYKGKMLGTLPSKYLKWVSKTLRARDFEEWSKLADEVLQDPVYRDRIEWELAENILNGNSSSKASGRDSSVSDLLEISERFNWNNEDKVGWSRIDFALLGTSNGGRIPRNGDSRNEKQKKFRVSQIEGMGSKNEEVGGSLNKDLGLLGKEFRVSNSENLGMKDQRKVGYLKEVLRVSVDAEEGIENENGVKVRREERRKKQRLKRGLQVPKLRVENGGKNRDKERANDDEDQDQDQAVEYHNRFPGREALLRKVLSNRRPL
ncbi:uncharacterized protein LOC122094186 [Macadamia integrifolia]|uniref:uncharacterized protein LOC122094186 n=1 Tax=Macadamia integrifolia TaxID=60698 RepID=UPI001C532C6E|nr:uncharacterized protein LOC122094186 [Macadamia integrifolia]